MHRKHAADPVHFCVGHMTDNLQLVAGYIIRLTGYAICYVWVDDDASFNVGLQHAEFEWPSNWLVGVYSAGIAIEAVTEDLETAREQWSTMFATD